MPDLMREDPSRPGLILPPHLSGGTGQKSDEEYAKDELDLVTTINRLIVSGSRIPPDLRVDDRDCPEFPNFYTYCFSKDGFNQAPFARQLALATYLLAEACPRCSNPAFWDLSLVPVDFPAEDFPSRVTFLEYGVCPKCQATKSEMYRSGELRVPVELDACLGQRSGKSALWGMLVPYIMHKWLKMNKPGETLGLLRNSPLTGTMVALTFAKAMELLYIPVQSAIEDAPWFQRYHEVLDHYGEKHGVELYKFKDTFLHYGYKNLFLAPSGPNKRTLRGANRFLAIIDELGLFSHGEDSDHMERASANEVYTSLDNSLVTVRGAVDELIRKGQNNIPHGWMGCISSPISYMDKMMTLIRANAGAEDVVTAHLPTWEFNPTLPRNSAFIIKKFREDPVKAERDFGANPPMAENPWMSNIEIIEKLMTGTRKRAVYRYREKKSTSGNAQRYAELTSATVPQPCPGTILSIDAGYSNNSLGVAITAPSESGAADVMAVLEVAPVRNQNVLNYTWIVRELLAPLIDHFNVKLVLADRWQSIKLLQDIEEDHGIFTAQYSMRGPDFDYIYDTLIDDRTQLITLPRPEMKFKQVFEVDLEDYPHCFKNAPAAHLLHQFKTATIGHKGVIDKGAGYTDDILRAVCLGLHYALDPEMVAEYEILGATQTRVAGPVGTRKSLGQSAPMTGIGIKQGYGEANKTAMIQHRGTMLGARG